MRIIAPCGARYPKVIHGRQGAIYFSGSYQRIDCLRRKRGGHFHQYRPARRLRAPLAQGIYYGMAGSRRSCIFCGPACAARNRNHRTLDRRLVSFAVKPSESSSSPDRWYLPQIRHEKFCIAGVLHHQNFLPFVFFRAHDQPVVHRASAVSDFTC
jgi:hypothetical protein